MIKTMSRYALLSAFALFLAGCVTRTEEPAPVDQAKPGTEQPTTPAQPVPTVPSVPTIPAQPGPIEHPDDTAQPAPRVRHYDWNGAMQPMVGKMLQAQGVTPGSVLLVDSVNNRTNGSLNAGEATETLRNALANNGKFTVVCQRVAQGFRRFSRIQGTVCTVVHAVHQQHTARRNALCLQHFAHHRLHRAVPVIVPHSRRRLRGIVRMFDRARLRRNSRYRRHGWNRLRRCCWLFRSRLRLIHRCRFFRSRHTACQKECERTQERITAHCFNQGSLLTNKDKVSPYVHPDSWRCRRA